MEVSTGPAVAKMCKRIPFNSVKIQSPNLMTEPLSSSAELKLQWRTPYNDERSPLATQPPSPKLPNHPSIDLLGNIISKANHQLGIKLTWQHLKYHPS